MTASEIDKISSCLEETMTTNQFNGFIFMKKNQLQLTTDKP